MNTTENTKRSSSSTRAARIALTGAVTVGLAACAPSFKADVSRFQAQLPAPQGQTFAVVAEDPALQGGLEFDLYADYVAAEMGRLGYTEAASPETANLLVRFDYGVDNGRERVRTVGGGFGPAFGPWGGFGGFGGGFGRFGRFGNPWAFGFYDPWLAGPQVRSYTVYVGEVELKIDDAATGERLFEGEAQAASRSNRLQQLVPNLVDAMFTDFPGNSGEVVRITVKDDEPNKVKEID